MDLGGIGTRSIELDEDWRHKLESDGQGESGAWRDSEKIGRQLAGEGKEHAPVLLLDLGFGGRV